MGNNYTDPEAQILNLEESSYSAEPLADGPSGQNTGNTGNTSGNVSTNGVFGRP